MFPNGSTRKATDPDRDRAIKFVCNACNLDLVETKITPDPVNSVKSEFNSTMIAAIGYAKEKAKKSVIRQYGDLFASDMTNTVISQYQELYIAEINAIRNDIRKGKI
jgi:hypothetical protein